MRRSTYRASSSNSVLSTPSRIDSFVSDTMDLRRWLALFWYTGKLVAFRDHARTAIVGKLRSLFNMPPLTLALLIPGWTMIGLATAMIRCVRMRRLIAILGRPLGPVACVPVITEAQTRRANSIGLAIRTSAKYSPWRSNCLPQALAASLLCRILGVPAAVHFGVTCNHDQSVHERLAAHAWVVSGQVAVTGGYASFRRYTAVGCWMLGPDKFRSGPAL